MSICDIYISTFAQSNPRAKVALALSKERRAVMKTAIDNFSIKPGKLSFRERAYLYARAKYIESWMKKRPRRAAFWLLVCMAITEDSLKN